MQYRRLGFSDLLVSRICLGTGTFCCTVDRKTAHALLSTARQLGGNFFDTADSYGDPNRPETAGTAERMLGEWLRGVPRDQVVIATKVGDRTPQNPSGGLSAARIIESAEHSLRRMKTDTIDLYVAHRPDPLTPLQETYRAFDSLIQAGKIRYAGLSNCSVEQLEACLSTTAAADGHGFPLPVSLQSSYHMMDRQRLEGKLLERCIARGLGVTPYGVLAGGFLTGKYRPGQPIPAGSRGSYHRGMRRHMTRNGYELIETLGRIARSRHATVAQVVIAWTLGVKGITSVLIGATDPTQVAETFGNADLCLDPDSTLEIDRATRQTKI